MSKHSDTTNTDSARIIHRDGDAAFGWPTIRWIYEDGTQSDEALDAADLDGLRAFIAAGGSIQVDTFGRTGNPELTEDDLADWPSAMKALGLVHIDDLGAVITAHNCDAFVVAVRAKRGPECAEWARLHLASAEAGSVYIDLNEACWLDFSAMPADVDAEELEDEFDALYSGE